MGKKFDDIIQIHRPSPKQKIIKEIAERWSPRHYSSSQIPKADLATIFEAARWAPSGHNQQPWYFYYAKKGTNSYHQIFTTLNDYNQSWAKTAPLLILACAIISNKEGENPYAYYDLGASVVSLILQAQSMGYYARQMALFDKEKVKKSFKLEKDLQPYIVIALGKIGDYENAPQTIIKYESEPRPRKTNFVQELD